jgi:hypothetical protein
MVERPMWCCAHLKSPTGFRIQRAHHASRVSASSRPVAPCDPAGGARAGRCAGGEEVAESAGLVLADVAFQGGCPVWCVTH